MQNGGVVRVVAGRARVSSAGSQPADQVNPAVVAAMAEIGLDISREYPKPLTTGNVQAADVVITMGCGDACPIYPSKRYEDWDLPGPAGHDLSARSAMRPTGGSVTACRASRDARDDRAGLACCRRYPASACRASRDARLTEGAWPRATR